jgi:hypothetical protein
MVAKIKSGKSLIGALNYNEKKVKQEKAQLIDAVGYMKEATDLNFYEKLIRLTDLAERNERTKTNTVHISLNFANGDNIPEDKLNNIAVDYMKGIGFENQPYLVYQHFDAGHPHVHIVTTNIKSDGYRISLHYLGQNESEKARKAIEIKYGLIKAEKQQKQKPDLKAKALAADYGKAETKRVITNVLSHVLHTYKFTSVPELNAVLQGYNLQADRGSKSSRMFAHEGLVYWITDKQGNKVGVPIKASTVYGKPTLKTLEEKFRLNETLRKPLKENLKTIIAQALKQSSNRQSFHQALRAENVQVRFRWNEEGRIYGVTFIDHKNKAVFNGSDLGKEFSANPMNERFTFSKQPSHTSQQNQDFNQSSFDDNQFATHLDVMDILLQPNHEDTGALNKIKRESRKGNRKGLSI